MRKTDDDELLELELDDEDFFFLLFLPFFSLDLFFDFFFLSPFFFFSFFAFLTEGGDLLCLLNLAPRTYLCLFF